VKAAVLAGLIVPGLCFAQAAAGANTPDGTVIPLRIRENFPLVDVRIGDQKVTLLFDTGDSRGILLDQSVIDRAHARPTGASSKVVDVKGNVIETPQYRIPRLQIGSIELKTSSRNSKFTIPRTCPINTGSRVFWGRIPQALPGRDRLPARPAVPVQARQFRAGAECRGTPVPFAGQWNGEPVTEVETDLGRIVLWWDTGTPLSILTTRIAQPTWPEVKEGPVTSRRLWVGGKDFGPWTFEVVNLTLPPGFEGFLGHDFYAKHVVCMDFPNKKLLVRNPDGRMLWAGRSSHEKNSC
jgi:hypothetical protein